ncbi:transmembrane protein 203-like [Acanthaster planci]|uniref:Transmembrane protein 203-like n=1 Tax=Acanthaster planci TaxID=133434 RepID=A0A8B7ZVV8_ACAPL|nr:transmembrane protein 203-like [Acanthaster planci]XP_022109227.1 transmembrane protein 203-like [Acanthaster planci]
MLFTLTETVQWLGVTVFELWVHTVSLLVFSILLTLKLQGAWAGSWWLVFAPLFTGDGLSAYFMAIVAIRLYLYQGLRAAAVRLFWSSVLLALVFVFKILLCKRLEGEADIPCSITMSPLFAMLQVLFIRACQV